MSLNKVMLIGNLGAKPELKYLPSGQAVCEMRLATNERWTDKDGAKQERVEWHRIVVWGKTGENCAKYLDKGRQCYVEGRIQTRTWDDKEGKKHYMTEIIANQVTFLSSGKGGPSNDEAPPPREDPGSGGGGTGASGPPADDDIPF